MKSNEVHEALRRAERLKPWQGNPLTKGAWLCSKCKRIHNAGNPAAILCPFCGLASYSEWYAPLKPNENTKTKSASPGCPKLADGVTP